MPRCLKQVKEIHAGSKWPCPGPTLGCLIIRRKAHAVGNLSIPDLGMGLRLTQAAESTWVLSWEGRVGGTQGVSGVEVDPEGQQ